MTSKRRKPKLAASSAIQLLAAVVSAEHRAQGDQGLRKFDKTESLTPPPVIPAKAGIQLLGVRSNGNGWIPASAGMTNHLHGPSTKPSYRRRPVSSFYARFSPTPKSWIPAFAGMTSKEKTELAAFSAIQLLAAVVSAWHRAQGGQGLRKFDKTESLTALRAAL